MMNFLEFLHIFVENIMNTNSYKMSSGSLQQMIQHLSFIVNVGSSSSSEYLLDILMEEHKNIMVNCKLLSSPCPQSLNLNPRYSS